MFDNKKLDDLVNRLVDAVPESFKALPHELEKTFRAILQSAFARLDLVTREEFDAQTKVLARTRKKVDDMEEQLSALEAQLLHPKKDKPHR